MISCRGCGESELSRVLDLGEVPAADFFPPATDPIGADEACHQLAMDVCHGCGLAQLADDDTITEEPRGIEPQALKDQAGAAVRQVAADGWLRGDSVLEFGSPHGGTWIPMLAERGFSTASSRADVVLDCFGVMHEPDQRSAFARRAQATNPDGVLLLQYHSIVTIVCQGQWNAVAARAFRLLLVDDADTPARRGRYACPQGLGLRSVWRNRDGRGRAWNRRARRVGAAHPRGRGRTGHNDTGCHHFAAAPG